MSTPDTYNQFQILKLRMSSYTQIGNLEITEQGLQLNERDTQSTLQAFRADKKPYAITTT